LPMRRIVSSFLTLIFVSTALLAVSCGPDDGSEPETQLEYGFEERTPLACESSLILDALMKVCNYYAQCDRKEVCSRVTQELFTGTTLQSVSNPSATYWNEFGGRGALMSDAGICMLKELSKKKVTNEATAKLLNLFPVTVKQTLGFLHYDTAAKSMDGYQTVNVCLPMIGCFDARQQAFSAAIKRRSPAHPEGKSCGNFPVQDSYGMRITAEEKEQNLTAKIDDIKVSTPYGPIIVRPEFRYSGELKSRFFPITGDTYTSFDTEHHEVHFHDIYGRIPGVNISVAPKDTTPSGIPTDTGWMSQIGLGSRQANDNSPLWKRDPDAPRRPDFDLSQARSAEERNPVVKFEALATISYKPPLPKILTESPIFADLGVFAIPRVRAQYVTQFDVFFNEFTASLRDAGPALELSSAQMLTRAGAYAAFEIEAGLDLLIKFTSIIKRTLVDTHPRVKFVIAANEDKGHDELVGYASSGADPRSGTPPKLDTYASSGSGAQRSATDFVASCVATPEPDQPKPESSFIPGSADILEMTQFPCNICVAHGAESDSAASASAFSTLVHPSISPTAGPRDWSCNQYHSGCFDMCNYDPATGQLAVTKTAVQMSLRGGTPSGDTGYACGENPPR